MSNVKLKRNIPLYYIFSFFQIFYLYSAVMTLYYLDLGFSHSQIMLLFVFMAGFQLLLEVPSGLVADKYGRKVSLIISSTFYLIASIILAVFEQYYLILISFILSGVKLSFRSGSDSALLYDTLIELKRKKDYPKISGHAGFIFFIGTGISSLLGGFIANAISIKFTIYLTILSPLISLIATLFFVEPKRHNDNSNKLHTFKDYFIEAVSVVKNNNKLLWLIVIISLMHNVFVILFNYMQIFLNDYGVELVHFGPLYFCFLVITALSSKAYPKLNKMFSDYILVKLFVVLMLVSLFLLSGIKSLYFCLISIIIFEALWGIKKPLVSHYINKEVGSHVRATVLSLNGFISALGVIIISYFVGLLTDNLGLHQGFLIYSSFISLAFLFLLPQLKRHY